MSTTTQPQFSSQPVKQLTCSSLNILFASGSPVERKLAVNLLEKHGHRVSAVASPGDALELLAVQPWDVVLIDQWVADADSRELCRALRCRLPPDNRRAAILALREDESACLDDERLEVDGVLHKPLTVEQFSTCVARLRAVGQSDVPSVATVNWCEVLEAVGGEQQLLLELVDIFFQEYPPTLDAIRVAVERGDAKMLQLFAHKLKGCLRYFGPSSAVTHARELEAIGKAGRLDGAPGELRSLEAALEQLLPALRTIRA
ncbi:MAG: Hpt domain-containing protein [Pirellulaceae bacterium]